MFKVTIIVTLLALGLAQESVNDSPDPQDTNITKLDLSKKGLTSLNDYDFSKYVQLEEVDLSDNDLTHIKEQTFSNNKKLRTINLSGNKHLEFPKFSTIFISDIKKLNISNCNIEALPQSAFDGLRYLKTIDLSNNPLRAKGFHTTPFNTIESLEKIILPVENKALLKEICLKSNVSIDIINKDGHISSPECSNYVKYVEYEDEESEEVQKPAIPNSPVNEDKPPAKVAHEEISELKENAEDKKPADDPSVKNEPAPPSVPDKPKLEPRENVDEKPTSNETSAGNVAPEVKLGSVDVSPAANEENNTKEEDNKPKLEPRVDLEIPSNVIVPANNETIQEGIKNGSIPMNVTADLNVTNININEQPLQLNTTNATGLNPPQEVMVNSSDALKTNQSEKMQIDPDSTIKVGEATQASNTGSTILIVLVVLVVVAGLAAFGYKFYKNRTSESRPETVDRELKEIVSSKPARPEATQDFVEKEPLMNNHVNKENGDVKGNQSTSKDESIENKLNAHVGPVNTFNSAGPYKSTTFKPEDEK